MAADDPQGAGGSLYEYPSATGTYYFPTLNKVQNIYSKLLIFQKYLSLLYSRYCVNGELGLGYPPKPHSYPEGSHRVAAEWRSLVYPIFPDRLGILFNASHNTHSTRPNYSQSNHSWPEQLISLPRRSKNLIFSCIKPTFVIFFCQNNKIFA